MTSIDPHTKTAFATMDWEQYHQSRPPYPPSLTSLIYTYRRLHPHTRWERLVDIGAGSGIATTNFMADFQVIHVSDPSPANESQARTFLPKWAAQHGLHPTFEYAQTVGEEAYRHTGESQVDMVICATAAHFMDPDGLVTSIGKMLRPGGTMAIFSYWLPTFPKQSKRFQDAFASIFEKVFMQQLLRDGPQSNQAALMHSLAKRQGAGEGLLDSLPLPEELFEDPVRVYINPSKDGRVPYHDQFVKYYPADFRPEDYSRVGSRDKIVRYNTGVDDEAEGWEFNADKQWLIEYLNSVLPPQNKIVPETAHVLLADWDQVFAEECPSGQVRVQWTANLVMATRKGEDTLAEQ
ncbi:hypothetical protein AbraIFM66950_009967 [Aspergillus brasiliensis]|nr:hypothetical protein AbraIFM66950_009967 [Aspergillus brasiliensis]